MTPVIRTASAADRGGVTDLLVAARLPLDGLSEKLEHFLVADQEGRIVAAAGIELYEDSALLRSVVVTPELRGTGMGGRLSDASLALARALGARHAYLLTDTAEDFFRGRGFETVDRMNVPAGIRNSVEFAVACPASATVMRRTLEIA